MEETNTQAKKPTKVCPNCGQEIAASAKKCRHCGEWLEKQCPYCGEWINVNANKCKHCGNWLSEAARRKYENSMGLTHDNDSNEEIKAQLAAIRRKQNVGCFERFSGCLLDVENLVVCCCIGVAYGWSYWVIILACLLLSALLSIKLIRNIYQWLLVLFWGIFGYGAGGWICAIIFALISIGIHEAANRYEAAKSED